MAAGFARIVGLVIALLLVAAPASAQVVTLRLLSHRYPALEFYANALVTEAPKGVKVETELMTYIDWQTKMRINLSAKSDAYDITYVYPPDLGEFASRGWLYPLDDLIKKYDTQFHFSDIPESVWDAYRYKGKIYGIPHHQWASILFYRKDLLDTAGIAVPKTLDQFVEAAAKLTTDKRFGTVMWLKPADHLSNQFQVLLTATGGWWFDKNMKPAFNSPEALLAVEYIQKLLKYSPPGTMNFGTDETMVALLQDQAALAIQHGTRAAAMSDPKQSRVVGQVAFAVPPSLKAGGPPASITASAGYAIPAFTRHDPDLIFRTIAQATDRETQVRGGEVAMPVRVAALTPELLQKRPDYRATFEAVKAGARIRPTIPEFNTIQEVAMKELSRALAGQVKVKDALDSAAREAEEVLRKAGYYK
jgi:ABC-type glycerol-3-phosphate transport system substrate-binding protein